MKKTLRVYAKINRVSALEKEIIDLGLGLLPKQTASSGVMIRLTLECELDQIPLIESLPSCDMVGIIDPKEGEHFPHAQKA